jgi:hypothetical protein
MWLMLNGGLLMEILSLTDLDSRGSENGPPHGWLWLADLKSISNRKPQGFWYKNTERPQYSGELIEITRAPDLTKAS